MNLKQNIYFREELALLSTKVNSFFVCKNYNVSVIII